MPPSTSPALAADDEGIVDLFGAFLLQTAQHCSDLLHMAKDLGAWEWCGAPILGLTSIGMVRGDLEQVALLHGAVAGQLPDLRSSLPTAMVLGYERAIGRARDRLTPARFDSLARSMAGRSSAAAVVAALDYASTVTGHDGAPVQEPRASPSRLSERELEVLAHIVDGWSNKEIASVLAISAKTVMHHTSSIYRKLGVRSRAEAAVWGSRNAQVVRTLSSPVGSTRRQPSTS